MQIAMALTHEAGGAAGFQPGGVALQGGEGGACQLFHRVYRQDGGRLGQHGQAVGGDGPIQPGPPAPVAPHRRIPMEGGDGLGQAVAALAVQFAPPGQLVEQGVLIEAAHLHRPIHHLAAAIQFETAPYPAGQGTDTEIEIGRGAAVDLQLRLTGRLARRQRGEVEKRQVDRLLQLEDTVTGQEQGGNMGVDALHRRTAMAARIGKEVLGLGGPRAGAG